MCGAFSIRISPSDLRFLREIEPYRAWKPIYNARPGEWLPIVTQEYPQTVTSAVWNFLPPWAKDEKFKGVINAKSETAAEKPFFRSAFKKRRCVIPADGFYEWARKDHTIKVPYFFHRKDDQAFAFAGLYEPSPKRPDVFGFTIMTTEPNALVQKYHDRMPVMLDDKEVSIWLDPNTETKALKNLLDPYPAEKMECYPVSRRVNYAREKGPELIQRLR